MQVFHRWAFLLARPASKRQRDQSRNDVFEHSFVAAPAPAPAKARRLDSSRYVPRQLGELVHFDLETARASNLLRIVPMKVLLARVVRVFGLLCFCCAASLLHAEQASIDPRIFEGKAEEEPASFLLVLREQADLSGAATLSTRAEKAQFVYQALNSQAEVTQAALRERLAGSGATFRPYYLVNMIEVRGTRALARELAGRPEVSAIAANPEIHREPEPQLQHQMGASPSAFRLAPAAAAAVEPNIALIRAPQVWNRGFTGEGVVVGGADTGFVWDHASLKPHYRGFDGVSVSHDYNWHDAVHDPAPGNPCGATAPTPCDDSGHGTATASLIVGDDGIGNQVGVAPGARFIGCRNMDRGVGTPARYTECFQFLLAPTDRNGMNPRPDLGADVINNSWGCPASEGCTDPNVLRAVVENVRAAGIFVVVSAGNEGPNCSTIGIPATYAASFTVAATTQADTIASFSSRGTVTADGSNRLKPDISAPGVGLRVAAAPSGYRGGFSGTSGSAPEVAGAVALVWSAAPAFAGHPDATADLLRRTAVPLTSTQDCGGVSGSTVPNAVFGFGRVDVANAVAVAAPILRGTPVPGARRHTPSRALPPR